MSIYQDTMVLCAANAYTRKFFLNEHFESLPETIKDELKVMCSLFVEEVSGILTLVFDEDGTLLFQVTSNEDDFFFDEIGSVLKVKQMQREQADFFESLETYYKVFVLGEEYDGEIQE